MVSGVTGEEFAAEIFIGPVYYQRLRHMVSDKFQVRGFGKTLDPSIGQYGAKPPAHRPQQQFPHPPSN